MYVLFLSLTLTYDVPTCGLCFHSTIYRNNKSKSSILPVLSLFCDHPLLSRKRGKIESPDPFYCTLFSFFTKKSGRKNDRILSTDLSRTLRPSNCLIYFQIENDSYCIKFIFLSFFLFVLRKFVCY